MQNYKIIIPSVNISRQVQEKAFELGYAWGGVSRIATNLNRPALFVDSSDNTICFSTNADYNSTRFTEISYQDFLRLGEQSTINNKTTEIMSEITLKCITAPQKAKNITVDRDYTGILIDSDDSQVDSLREATHFRCVNNNGIEAKYKLSLFTTITPPPPPRPQFPTWEQIESNISVSGDGEVIVDFNDEEHIVFDNSYPDLENCACCGLKEVNGIQNLYESIDRNCVLSLLQNQSDARRLKNLIFKKIIEDIITETAGAFKIFSIVSGYDEIDALMEEILAERGGVATEYTRSTSSGNDLKVFLIKV